MWSRACACLLFTARLLHPPLSMTLTVGVCFEITAPATHHKLEFYIASKFKEQRYGKLSGSSWQRGSYQMLQCKYRIIYRGTLTSIPLNVPVSSKRLTVQQLLNSLFCPYIILCIVCLMRGFVCPLPLYTRQIKRYIYTIQCLWTFLSSHNVFIALMSNCIFTNNCYSHYYSTTTTTTAMYIY